jgi:hypothetical protein
MKKADPIQEGNKLLIPTESYKGLLNRRGQPCSTSYLNRLIKNGTAPFEHVWRNGRTYIVSEIKETKK